jgi:hypothetical protein
MCACVLVSTGLAGQTAPAVLDTVSAGQQGQNISACMLVRPIQATTLPVLPSCLELQHHCYIGCAKVDRNLADTQHTTRHMPLLTLILTTAPSHHFLTPLECSPSLGSSRLPGPLPFVPQAK